MGCNVEDNQPIHSKVWQRDNVGVWVGRPENSDGRDRDLPQRKWQHRDGQSYYERRRRVDSRPSKWTRFYPQLAALALIHPTCPLPPVGEHQSSFQDPPLPLEAAVIRCCFTFEVHFSCNWMRINLYFILSGQKITWAKDDILPMKELVENKTCVIPQIPLIKDHLVFLYHEYYHWSILLQIYK